MRAIAVDWSGAARPERVIWVGEVAAGRLARLECGRTREDVGEFLVAAARQDELVVGLDFAFSVPGWYVEELGLGDVRSLWEQLGRRADSLIARPHPPFWGRDGKAASGLTREREFRATELHHPPAKSVFQLIGAGQVGSGTLRGMRLLCRLDAARFAIWPFDNARSPLAVEIYPRSLIGELVRKDPRARGAWLTRFEEIGEQERGLAAANEHAFDAAVSAVVLWRHRERLLELRADPEYAFEGRIWAPGSVVTSD